MLLLFRKKSEPLDLPDIKIRDASNQTPTPIACVKGWDNDLIQAQLLINAPLEFINLGSVSSGSETPFKSSMRKQYALLSATFSVSGANATIYSIYKDKNKVEVLGERKNISEVLNGKAAIEKFDVFGASAMKFYIESVSSGTLSLKIAFV